MIIRQVRLKEDTPDKIYTAFCNLMERQGVFVACGSPDDKWINLRFENELDYLAWMIAMGETFKIETEEEK